MSPADWHFFHGLAAGIACGGGVAFVLGLILGMTLIVELEKAEEEIEG